MLGITFKLNCTCGGEMMMGMLDMSQDGGDEVEVNLSSLSQCQMICQDCGRTVYSSDIDEFFLEM